MGKILEIMDLSFKEFDNINISFNDKTFYSIVGSNNSGKTTLFKLISGVIPTNDIICCNDVDLNNHSIYEYITNLGIVERLNNKSFIYRLVFDEMLYPLNNLGLSHKYSINRINEVLSLFSKEHLLNKKINELSYYDKELLLIMIALLHKPKVLLLDNVLEVFPKDEMKSIIKILKKLDITVINFTSSLEVASLSNKIILLDKGKIVGEYKPSDIYQDDKLFYEHNLEIPLITDLSIKLKMYDVIDKEYASMKEMVGDIWP